MLATPIKFVIGCIKFAVLGAMALIVFMLFAGSLFAGEHRSVDRFNAVTRNITVPSSTGIGSRIIGDLYTPYPGARTQIRERSSTGIGSRIRGYIEPDGTITDADTRQEIGTIDGLLGNN